MAPGVTSEVAEVFDLVVSVFSATGLRPMNNLVDDAPYCVCEVKRTGYYPKRSSFQTPFTNMLESAWHQKGTIKNWKVGDPLEFTIYNKGLIGSRSEGAATLTSEQFYPHGFDGELELDGSDAKLHVRVSPALGAATRLPSEASVSTDIGIVGAAKAKALQVGRSSQRWGNDALSAASEKASSAITFATTTRAGVACSSAAAGAVACGATCGSVGTAAGAIAGGAAGTVGGAIAGVPVALFTFGVSIPVFATVGLCTGAAAGGALGAAGGAALGSTAGAVGGATTGYVGFTHKDAIKEKTSEMWTKLRDSTMAIAAKGDSKAAGLKLD